MREVHVTDDPCRWSRDASACWRPLAQQLAARFARNGDSDERLVRVAIDTIADVERRLGSRPADFCLLVVPQVICALRRHRCEQVRRRPASAEPRPARQRQIAIAENELSGSLGHAATVAEIAQHLDVAEDQIVESLVSEWSGVLSGATE